MRAVGVIGLLFCLWVPPVFAGLVRLDVEDLECVDWDTGDVYLGGSLSFLINESTLDTNAHTGLGFYQGALTGGHFYNALNGKTYQLDLFAVNHVQVEIGTEMYTGITLRGSFSDEEGNSRLFDLWMEATYKTDDYLHNLKTHVSIMTNTVIFNLFEPSDHFEGLGSRSVRFSPVVTVFEPASWLLLLMGIGALAARAIRKGQANTAAAPL